MSERTLYQDVTEAELARERRYEKRRQRRAKVDRAKRLADLRETEEMEAASWMASDAAVDLALAQTDA